MLDVDTGGQRSCINGFTVLREKLQQCGWFPAQLYYSYFLPSSAVDSWSSKPVLILKGKDTWKGFGILH